MSSDEFENFEITYTYEIWQFPDGERGVGNLFEDLGSDETILAQLNFSQNMTITEKLDRLNTLLGSEAFFTHIVDANILNDASLNHDMKYTWSTVSQDDKIRLCRNLLDEFYDASPHAVIDAPEKKHARVRLGVGVWLDVDLTLQSVERILDDIFGANAIIAYLKVKAKADHFNYTDLYFGIEDWNAPYTDITFEPWLKFNPSFGLGVSAVSVRASAPITVGGHSVFFLYGAGGYQNGGERFGIRDLGVFLSVYFIPYFEANLKIVKIKKNFATLKPVDHNLILYPEPVRFERRKDN